MGAKAEDVQEADAGALVKEVVRGLETMLGQHARLLKAEVGQELSKAGGAAVSLGAGAGLLAAGGAMSTLMAVHLLHRTTRLPLWACYGAVAGALGVAGAGLMAVGRRQAAHVRLTELPQTVAAVKENLTWAKDQVTSLA